MILFIFLVTKSCILENSLLMNFITILINFESSSLDFNLNVDVLTSLINSGPFKTSEFSLNEFIFLNA